MSKNKKVTIHGIEILVPCKYENPRHKFTTNLDEDLYDFIKEIKSKTGKDISQIMDCMVLTLQDNKDYLKDFLLMLQDY